MDASHPSRVRALDATLHEPPIQLRIGEHSTAIIAMSVKDYKTLCTLFSMSKRSLNPMALRRIGP